MRAVGELFLLCRCAGCSSDDAPRQSVLQDQQQQATHPQPSHVLHGFASNSAPASPALGSTTLMAGGNNEVKQIKLGPSADNGNVATGVPTDTTIVSPLELDGATTASVTMIPSEPTAASAGVRLLPQLRVHATPLPLCPFADRPASWSTAPEWLVAAVRLLPLLRVPHHGRGRVCNFKPRSLPPSHSSCGHVLRGRRVLLVENNASAARLQLRLLTGWGLRCVHVATADRAMRLLQRVFGNDDQTDPQERCVANARPYKLHIPRIDVLCWLDHAVDNCVAISQLRVHGRRVGCAWSALAQ